MTFFDDVKVHKISLLQDEGNGTCSWSTNEYYLKSDIISSLESINNKLPLWIYIPLDKEYPKDNFYYHCLTSMNTIVDAYFDKSTRSWINRYGDCIEVIAWLKDSIPEHLPIKDIKEKLENLCKRKIAQ